MPQYLAEQYGTTQYVLVEGNKVGVLKWIDNNVVPIGHPQAFIHDHDSYGEAMKLLFMQPQVTEAIGVVENRLDVDSEKLTIVLEEDQ